MDGRRVEKYSEDTAQEWARRYQDGESLSSIGRDYGVGHQTVRNYLTRRGIRIRSGGEQMTGFERDSTPSAEVTPTVVDLHWAAGFIEGEGHIRRTNTCATIKAAQNDTEPLRRLQRLFGGSIIRQGERCHSWTTYGARARGIIMTLFPLLSCRRQEQANSALPH